MKKISVLFVIFFASTLFSCGVFIPDYMENSERNSQLDYKLKAKLVEKEIENLDSASIYAVAVEDKFYLDSKGRKLFILANPHSRLTQKVIAYDCDGNILYEGTLAPKEIKKEYFFQTVDEKVYCTWTISGNIPPVTVIKDFPMGHSKTDYLGEPCHGFSYGFTDQR